MEKLEGFSDATRIWIYQSNRILQASEIKEINTILVNFNKEWATHGSKMKTACFVVEPCFIFMAVDQSAIEASGCSIDSSVKVLKEIESKFNIDLFDRLNLTYVDSQGQIQMIKMGDFQEGLKAGIFTEETIVFNNLIDSIRDLESNWKTTVSKSWHKNLV